MTRSATGKRYAELPDVKIRVEALPRTLSPLLEDAKKWAIVGETGVDRAIRKASIEEMEAVVARAEPLKEELWKFTHESAGSRATPIPDEVVLFQVFTCVLQDLDSTVRLERSRTSDQRERR